MILKDSYDNEKDMRTVSPTHTNSISCLTHNDKNGLNHFLLMRNKTNMQSLQSSHLMMINEDISDDDDFG